MTPLQDLHAAAGELAYAMAFADGEVQAEERKKFFEIVMQELRNKDYNFDLAEILFKVIDKDKCLDVETAYAGAMKSIRLNSHYLTPELKDKFMIVMEKIAAAFPPVTNNEQNLLKRFVADIAPIHGDPALYTKKVH